MRFRIRDLPAMVCTPVGRMHVRHGIAYRSWPLMSPLARNAFFATNRMAYGSPPEFQARFYQLTPPHNLASGLAVAVVLSFLSARLGLAWGGWMARVQR